METCLPTRPIIGFRALSQATGVPEGTFRCQAHEDRLPFHRFQAGNQAAFDADEIAAWVLDGMPFERVAHGLACHPSLPLSAFLTAGIVA